MQIKIETTKNNPLLKRKEVGFTIIQGPKEKTPPRLEARKAVAIEMKIGDDIIVGNVGDSVLGNTCRVVAINSDTSINVNTTFTNANTGLTLLVNDVPWFPTV